MRNSPGPTPRNLRRSSSVLRLLPEQITFSRWTLERTLISTLESSYLCLVQGRGRLWCLSSRIRKRKMNWNISRMGMRTM
ncbi:unnamed protein product [Staurois parvus]|uniref:Uncharacterized protein n=1 Tax=Staurois parvus TaxID=386267 RepID=A0ABN9FJW6_9NEOB|nr:unnamed protein product [Staurois parvus]